MEIASKRLTIRALEPSDAAELARIAESEAPLSTFGPGGLPRHCSEDVMGRWIAEASKRPDERHLVAEPKRGKGLRALLSVTGLDERNRSGRICILCEGKAEKDAGEALDALLDFMFDRMNGHRAWAKVPRGDARAIRLHERCGLVSEGVLRQDHYSGGSWRDSVVMSVLAGESRRGRR